jgi:nucleotide-binding universal stress UspA family protein
MNAGLLKQAQAELAELSQPYAQANQLRVETLVTLGKPFREITRVAKERKVQMIIMGTHGYTGFQHFQLGSTAERVVRYASCPVLVVRQQEHTALTPDQAGSEPLPKSDLTP